MTTRQYKNIITLGLGGLLAFSSCKVSQTYKRPDVKAANMYRDSSSTDTASMASMPWRSLFSDTTLQNLIQEGINPEPANSYT
jgi:hypothetical protein